jgi:gamma-glutamyltranspeptidase/glutathione hydrolase
MTGPAGADVKVGFGIMGGWNQAQAHTQFVSNVVDHDMNIQAALEAARVSKISFTGCDVIVESRVPEAVRRGLAGKGHRSICRGRFRAWWGRPER